LSPAQEAASCHVPVTLVLGLEAGRTTEFVDEDDLLTTVERIATFLGFPPGLAASDILRAWSSAYARHLGDVELPVPLAPTQPLPLVSQPGPHPARSATNSPDISQGSRPGSRRTRPRSPPRPAGPFPGLARRRAPARRVMLGALSAIAVVGVAATVGAREAGLLGKNQRRPASSTSSPTLTGRPKASSPLLEKTSTGTAQTTYAVSASSYVLTVRSNRPSWVRVGPTTGAPQFAGIVTPGIAERLTVGGPVQIQIGAGGTMVTLSTGRSSATLIPPSAPYTYQLNPEPTGTRG
jgi:hypothetical protein